MPSVSSYWMKRAGSTTQKERLDTLSCTLKTNSPLRYHFIGIKGTGMWPLACALQHFQPQCYIQGSDLKTTAHEHTNPNTTIWNTHSENHLSWQPAGNKRALNGVVYTTAAREDHCERIAAKKHHINIYHRAEMLQALGACHNTSVAICGSCGKTSTTALLCHLLTYAQKQPTGIVGSGLINYDNHSHLGGNGSIFVYEADESDGSHTIYQPSMGILTNITSDHLDYHTSMEHLLASIKIFAQNCTDILIVPAQDPLLTPLLKGIVANKNHISVGTHSQAQYRIHSVYSNQDGCAFSINNYAYFLPAIGTHQAINAAFAIAASCAMGIPASTIQQALLTFQGVKRRLEKVFDSKERVIIDDYAHNPDKVRVAIAAVRSAYKDAYIDVIFEPHKLHRAIQYKNAFSSALSQNIQHIFLAPLYSPKGLNEEHLSTFNPKHYAKDLQATTGISTSVIEDYDQLGALTRQVTNSKDMRSYSKHVTLILGAGNSSKAQLPLLNYC
ncbi:MAG: Mur ligase family protein [Proteobacteria bacterium]|nr:Mur ligase family protein [Pseudomonadota bacterium]